MILNTDDAEIASVGREYGLEIPFLRPTELAADHILIQPVLKHMLVWLSENEGYHPDALVLLQPTSPFRLPIQIDQSVELFRNLRAGTVVSVVEVPHNFVPNSQMVLINKTLVPYQDDASITLRRQEKPTLYARNGPAILVVNSEEIAQAGLYSRNTYPFIMDRNLFNGYRFVMKIF